MILDFNYSKKKQQMVVSYIKENGAKALLQYNIGRFKTYVEDENGSFTNWNGNKCSVAYTDKPHKFDIMTFIKELPEADRKLLLANYMPKTYSFDIEVQCGDEFPEPSIAKYPVYSISIVNDDMDCVVFGLREMDSTGRAQLQERYVDYLKGSDYYNRLGLNPSCRFVKFDSEKEMLEYFLKNIIAKAPLAIGWNSIGFDWLYIVNRVKNYYPSIPLPMCSIDWSMTQEQHMDFRNNKYKLPVPCHTLIIDMMDVIQSDFVVMPIKESMSLDYIGSESPVGLGKVSYNGNLEQLYKDDYAKYIFYNCIDSALVQLINKCFGTLNNYLVQSVLCENKIKAAFSKIALTESLFFQYWYKNDIKICPPDKFSGDRGILQGAYVRVPTPGKHNYMCCNDFASLYPSTIITCNLSIENYVGSVLMGTIKSEDLDKYKNDPNYFVSVNGSVYKNDKDYSFRLIQLNLKNERAKTKYLSKQLDAFVMSDIDHFHKPNFEHRTYPEGVVNTLKEMGYDITKSDDLAKVDDIGLFKKKLDYQIHFMGSVEQSYKLLMNSMYGGTSHVAFAFFNIALANDITGEARNIIHLMEDHIPNWFQENWVNNRALHKKLGIKLRKEYTYDMICGA